MYVLFAMNNYVRAQLAWKQLTFGNHLNFMKGIIEIFMKSLHNFMVIMK